MTDKICQNHGCNQEAYKIVKLSNGAKQYRCEVCYKRKVAASLARK